MVNKKSRYLNSTHYPLFQMLLCLPPINRCLPWANSTCYRLDILTLKVSCTLKKKRHRTRNVLIIPDSWCVCPQTVINLNYCTYARGLSLKKGFKRREKPTISLFKAIYQTIICELKNIQPNVMKAHFKCLKNRSSKMCLFFKENTMWRIMTKRNILLKNDIKDGSLISICYSDK